MLMLTYLKKLLVTKTAILQATKENKQIHVHLSKEILNYFHLVLQKYCYVTEIFFRSAHICVLYKFILQIEKFR
jgi:hypothetical protein